MDNSLYTSTCANCGTKFSLSKDLEKLRRADHEIFYCPNGHALHFDEQTQADEKQEKQPWPLFVFIGLIGLSLFMLLGYSALHPIVYDGCRVDGYDMNQGFTGTTYMLTITDNAGHALKCAVTEDMYDKVKTGVATYNPKGWSVGDGVCQ